MRNESIKTLILASLATNQFRKNATVPESKEEKKKASHPSTRITVASILPPDPDRNYCHQQRCPVVAGTLEGRWWYPRSGTTLTGEAEGRRIGLRRRFTAGVVYFGERLKHCPVEGLLPFSWRNLTRVQNGSARRFIYSK